MHLRRTESEDSLGTLFYIHGLGESGRCFTNLSTHSGLSRWTHLVPDLVGYGDSPPADEPPTLEVHAERLAQLLAAEHPEPVVVVGHSMGGALGTILAETAPERVQALINIEGNISAADCTYSGRIVTCVEQEGLERGVDRFISELANDPGPQPRAVIASYLASVRRCDRSTLNHDARQLMKASEKEDLAARLAALKCPVTFIYGQSPGGLSARSLDLLSDVGIEPQPISGAGHWPFLEEPDEFVDAVGVFLGLGSHPQGSS